MPITTASTRKPCPSNLVAILDTSGDDPPGPKRFVTAEKAPLMISMLAPRKSTAIALAILVAESKGINLITWGKSDTTIGDAADRIAASTGSWLPSELARKASERTCASLKPAIGQTLVTLSSFLVKVPVLSAQSTSMLAA